MPLIKSYDTFSDVKEHIKRGHILSAGATITVPSNKIITVTDSFHFLLAGTNQVERINATVTAPAGQVLVLMRSPGGATVTIMSGIGSGNIDLQGLDAPLNADNDTLTLMYDGTKWVGLAARLGAASDPTD
tara:strand:- start:230 stop:622 length:393 start_codon:yes stop_codon:yes gene_type:complete